jgi:hypothetical protein
MELLPLVYITPLSKFFEEFLPVIYSLMPTVSSPNPALYTLIALSSAGTSTFELVAN